MSLIPEPRWDREGQVLCRQRKNKHEWTRHEWENYMIHVHKDLDNKVNCLLLSHPSAESTITLPIIITYKKSQLKLESFVSCKASLNLEQRTAPVLSLRVICKMDALCSGSRHHSSEWPSFPALIDDTRLILTPLLRPHQWDRDSSSYGKPSVLKMPPKLCAINVADYHLRPISLDSLIFVPPLAEIQSSGRPENWQTANTCSIDYTLRCKYYVYLLMAVKIFLFWM